MAGHEAMTIGLEQYRDPDGLTILRMLALPIAGRVGDYPINRRSGG